MCQPIRYDDDPAPVVLLDTVDALPSQLDAQLLASPRGRLATIVCAAAAGAVAVVRYEGAAAGWVAAFAVVVLVVLSAVDIERRRVPNEIVLPAAGVVLAARLVLDPAWQWPVAALGAASFFFVLAIVRPGLGMGDVKLMLLIGAALGSSVIAALLIGTVAGALFGVLLILRYGRAAGARTIPYVPFLALGAIVTLLLAKP